MIAADFQDRRRSGFSQIGLTRCLYVLGVLGWLTRPLFVFLPQICADYADYYMQRLGVSLTLVALHDCRRFSGPQAVWIYADWADAVNAAGFFTTNEHEWAQMAGAVNVDSYAGVQSRYTNEETLIGFAELSCQ